MYCLSSASALPPPPDTSFPFSSITSSCLPPATVPRYILPTLLRLLLPIIICPPCAPHFPAYLLVLPPACLLPLLIHLPRVLPFFYHCSTSTSCLQIVLRYLLLPASYLCSLIFPACLFTLLLLLPIIICPPSASHLSACLHPPFFPYRQWFWVTPQPLQHPAQLHLPRVLPFF